MRNEGTEGKLSEAALDAIADAVILAWKAGMRARDLPTEAPIVLVIEPGALEGLPRWPADRPPWEDPEHPARLRASVVRRAARLAQAAQGTEEPGSVIVTFPLDRDSEAEP